jgi:hypothetical protein
MDAMPECRVHVLRNLYFGDESSFDLYATSKAVRPRVEGSGLDRQASFAATDSEPIVWVEPTERGQNIRRPSGEATPFLASLATGVSLRRWVCPCGAGWDSSGSRAVIAISAQSSPAWIADSCELSSRKRRNEHPGSIVTFRSHRPARRIH